ncbi:restriction endonuclease subunit S [Paludibacter jiangxiensis]|uniref:Type I restriction enzyme, S subunit n=1 Tax=Paludibacter jiangxiensis TaxID=681398 RepID=A0A161LFR6_9BACT|nr:restriction endonuclease subunit S [Paludibacter jiangxiensis]GAT64025.1 type I restriction enzyme, S subunit [Paludibacter jiangxiensis]
MSSRIYKLKELVESFSVRAKDLGGSENLPFLGVSNEKGITESKYAAEEKGDDYKIIEKGCFAYNPYRINVGSIAYVEEDIKGLISPAYVLFKVKPNKVLPQLLLTFLKSSEGLSQIKQHARGTVRQALRFEDLCRIEVTLPDYDKQTEIIDRYKKNQLQSDSLSTELTHQLDLVRQLRQSFLREAMQGKLTADFRSAHPELIEGENSAQALLEKIKAEKKQLIKDGKLKKEKELAPIGEDEIPFEIPEGWAWCRLGEIAYNIEYGTSEKADLNSVNIPVLRMNNIQNGKIVLDNLKYVKDTIKDLPRLYLFNNDLLFNRTNSWELVGKSGVYKGQNSVMTFASYLIRIQFIEQISVDFINSYINSSFCRESQLEPHIIQQNGQANFNGTKLKNIISPLPPLSEQQAIVSKLDELMRTCDELEASIRASQQQNEMLLQQVLREALEEKKAEPVLQTVSATRKSNISERTILAAYLIRRFNSDGFGRVMMMKLLFLVEYICQIDFESKYVVNVAGPYDELILEIESKLRRYGIYDARKNKIDNHVRYHEMMGVATVDELFEEKFSGEKEQIESIISTFKKAKWEQCEIVATLYAVWNNRIIKGQIINDLALKQDFLNWDPRKQKYTDRLDSALDWMRGNNIIPAGWGSVIEK